MKTPRRYACPGQSQGNDAVTKAEQRRQALAAWWDRRPWPCYILTCDPGIRAGATLIESRPYGIDIVFSRGVDTYTREVEKVFEDALTAIAGNELPVVVVLEDWGRGGPMGIQQWIGLGEQRGAWRRLAVIEAAESPHRFSTKRIVKVTQSRWRSRVIEETGVTPPGGKWRKFNPDEWKKIAHQTARGVFPDGYVPEDPDAAESAMIAYYAARSDEVGKVLGVRYLKSHGYMFEPLEPLIKG